MVSFQEIERILEILDEQGLNREQIEIPLGRRDPGGLKDLGRGKCRVTVPENRPFDEWIEEIRPAILTFFGVEP
jgi:hypothetical protein